MPGHAVTLFRLVTHFHAVLRGIPLAAAQARKGGFLSLSLALPLALAALGTSLSPLGRVCQPAVENGDFLSQFSLSHFCWVH